MNLIPINPQWTASNSSEKRSVISNEIIAFSSASASSLTVPINADHAEIEVQNGSIRFMIGSSPSVLSGKRRADGQIIELESIDELNGFSFIGMNGNFGQLVIHYFSHNLRND